MSVQAWPPIGPETQSMQGLPPVWMPDQGPSQHGGHGIAPAAAPEAAGMPPTTQAVDTATEELMRLIIP